VSSRKQEIHLQIYQIVDAILIGLTFAFCYYLRAEEVVEFDLAGAIPPFEESLWILALCVPIGPVLLEFQGFYSYPLEKTTRQSLRQVLQAVAWLGLAMGVCVIFLRLEVPSRSVLILFAAALPFVLIARERLTTWWQIRALKRGINRKPVVLAGESRQIRRLLDHLPPTYRLEWNVVETINLEERDVDALVEAVHRHGVGRVILCFSRMELSLVQKAIEACEVEGVEAWLNADFIRTSVARPTYEVLAGKPMLVFRATPEISWALLTKSLIDRVGALLAIIVSSPVLMITAVAIKLTSPGPIIFRQQRAGLHGRAFTMLKFRSMSENAEQLRHELERINEMKGPVFKVSHDPRVTRLGRFLRKTSLDELPQLFNVLRGEMSLVGPRPLPTYEVNKFDKTSYRRRLSMKPGITCLWQIRGRNRVVSFDEWVAMDLEYIDNWSLALDLWILVRTIPAVLLARGAS